MFAIVLLFVLTGFASLIGYCMTRFSRAQVLSTLALLMRRGLPLERSLVELGGINTGSREERLIRRVAMWMYSGAELPIALRNTRIVTAQQAVALSVAQERGSFEPLLARMADEATRLEQRLVASGPAIVYPLVIGPAILLNTLFCQTFIVPKLIKTLSDMGIMLPDFDAAMNLSLIFSCALMVWGIVAWALQMPLIGRLFWWHVPWLGQPVRLSEQATFARNLGLMLGSGATLEHAITTIAEAQAGGPLQYPIDCFCSQLAHGDAPATAFRRTGKWREELCWAIETISQGAPAATVLEEVARVLEDRAKAKLDQIHRIFAPVAFLVSASGVGLMGYTIFYAITSISRSML